MIILIGDIHGNLKFPVYTAEQYDIKDSHIIICGDCGIGFYKENYYLNLFNILNKRLLKNNNILYFIRGNHDNPSYWIKNIKYSNIKFVKDYDILNIENKNILCVGGGISVDRTKRENGVDYWTDEKIIYKKLNDEQKNCEYLVTHVNGIGEFPFKKNGISKWLENDSTLEKDIDDEKEIITKIIDSMDNLKFHFYGHYHKGMRETINNSRRILLNIEEVFELN